MRLDPLEVTQHIHDDYTRYLKTRFFFRDPELRQQFWDALNAPDFLVRGPVLEAAMPFRLGRSISRMVGDEVLSDGFLSLCSEALPLERDLYFHQDSTIEKIVAEKRNVVVATGTGSGKTEAFLIPILDHLLREQKAGTLGSPGVRALLLYPMNALANDQLKRLRRVLEQFPNITFGRYTGETEEDDREAEDRFFRQFPDEPRIPNEFLSRRQIRGTPPHILLTNYAMLEYLLLRPEDCELFDGETGQFWRFIVLDEAHTYDGAAGIEIAMLLRRLKDRVVKSEPGQLTCIATSATLGQGRQDFPAVAEFASQLFGEPFEWVEHDPERQDVVEAEHQPELALETSWGEGSATLYKSLTTALEHKQNLEHIRQVMLSTGVPDSVVQQSFTQTLDAREDDRVGRMLYLVLRGDGRLHRLRQALTEPDFLWVSAQKVFQDDENARQYLTYLVDLATKARPGKEEAPLLPTRYHLFARALEGAFVCLNKAAHQEGGIATGKPRLFLTEQKICPYCGTPVFELATCPRCGTAYIVGQEVLEDGLTMLRQGTTLTEEYPGRLAYFALTGHSHQPDEDEAVVLGQDLAKLEEEKVEPYNLCLGCGALSPQGQDANCGCPNGTPHVLVQRVKLDKEVTDLTHCVVCGARRSTGAVYRFRTGRDAPVSVLATSLYQSLPPENTKQMQVQPGEGRKLLAFSDSRQDAAFFAPYVEGTYRRMLRRRLILKALLEDDVGRAGKLRLDDVANRLLQQTEEAGFFTLEQSYDERVRTLRTWLMQELVALDYRIGLEGLGLLTFRLVKPQGWSAPSQLLHDPWNLSPDEVWKLLLVLLDGLRRQGAVNYPQGVDSRDNAFAPRNKELFVREARGDGKLGLFGWCPARGSNRRLDFLVRLLARSSSLTEDEVKQMAWGTLEGLWQHLASPGTVWRSHFLSESHRQLGVVFRLNYKLWEWIPATQERSPLYRCNKCQAVSPVSLRGVCPTYGCDGILEAVPFDDALWQENHYRHRYLNMKPIPLRAEEHTAQWRPDEAGKIQDRFVRGEINLLSCSTTFELGVNLGSLQAVLMRNVPPNTAHYLQRAGRAGRQTSSAAFALTYAQRRSHDLSQYADPRRLVAGHIHPPAIAVENEKIVRRHAHSVLLAAFFRWAKQEQNRLFRNVGDFFYPEEEVSGPTLLQECVRMHPSGITESLYRITPPSLHRTLKLESWGWLSHLMNEKGDGILDLASREVTEDLDLYLHLEDEAATQHNWRAIKHYSQVATTVRRQNLLGFLGSRNVLPKYGFPTDVVELRTTHVSGREAGMVELQRDLRMAIAEYAPGGQVVAAKRVWTSAGIYKQPGQDWEIVHYAVCPECGRYHSAREKLARRTCEACGAKLFVWPGKYGRFLIPRFGFLAARETANTREKRPERFYSSRVFFANYQEDPEALKIDPSLSNDQSCVLYRYSRYGKLAVVNRGRFGAGFRICTTCGYAEPARLATNRPKRRSSKHTEAVHENPRTGKPCNGYLETYHLGHEFLTDVLELRFEGYFAVETSRDLWLSVLYALLEGASEALSIPRSDLDGTLYTYLNGQNPALVLFDNVPGGAALVRRVSENLPLVFHTAWKRVNQCECGEDTSCYQCLRNYYNQYYHEQLRRGLARDFLASFRGVSS